jgi:hypothetical protein
MNGKITGQRLCLAAALLLAAVLARPALPAVKNIAVIMAAGSKLQDVQLAELVKLCKGTQKTWADGRNFMLVMKDPAAPEMHAPLQKLFGMAPADFKSSVAKLNESRQLVKIVDSDEELLRTVEATPGAVGIVDVYAINSSVKVLRVDGKLPFDVGYALRSNLSFPSHRYLSEVFSIPSQTLVRTNGLSTTMPR